MADNLDQFSRASEASAQITEQAGRLPMLLRSAVTDNLQSSPLFGQREQAAQQVLTSATRGREEISNILQAGQRGEPGGAILSPTQQQSILTGRRAADVVPLLSLNDLIQAQTGGVETAIAGGLGLGQSLQDAAGQRAATELELAGQREATRQFDIEAEIARSKGAGGGGLLDEILARILRQTTPGDGGGFEQPTESQPEGIPSARQQNKADIIRSPRGEWAFDKQNQQWVPDLSSQI